MGKSFVEADAHAACHAALFLGLTGFENSCSQSTAAGIQPSGYHGCPGDKSGSRGCFGGHFADHCLARKYFGQFGPVQADFIAKCIVPAAGVDIECLNAIALREILGESSGQLHGDINYYFAGTDMFYDILPACAV